MCIHTLYFVPLPQGQKHGFTEVAFNIQKQLSSCSVPLLFFSKSELLALKSSAHLEHSHSRQLKSLLIKLTATPMYFLKNA